MKNKRFIAGAQCPSCKQVDKVYTYELEDKTYRACTRCDFQEELRFSDTRSELSTRVNRSSVERDNETQAVRIMDPSQPAE